MSKRKKEGDEAEVPDPEKVEDAAAVVTEDDVEEAEEIVEKVRKKVGDAEGPLAKIINARLDKIEETLDGIAKKVEKGGGEIAVENLNPTEQAAVADGRKPGWLSRTLGAIDDAFRGGKPAAGDADGESSEDSGRPATEAAREGESGGSERSSGE